MIINLKAPYKLWVLLFFLNHCPFAFSKNFFQHYTVSQGLPNNTIQCIFKDRLGFIWIGTSNGLSQYDGYVFRNFLNNPEDSTSLPNNNVRGIAEDKNGVIWLGLWGGVATFNPRTQKFTRLDLSFEKNHDKVLHLFCDSKNRIWISTHQGNYLFKTDGSLIRHWRAGKGKHELPHDEITCTIEDKSGNIWVSSRGGLCKFREKSTDFEVFLDDNPPYTQNNHWINCVMHGSEDKNGILWFGSWANGLRRFDPKKNQFQSWLTSPQFSGHGAYNVITGTAEFDGNIWLACHDQGLGYFDRSKNELRFLNKLAIQGYDMPIGKVSTLLADGDVLWIGTPFGIYKYDLRKQLFEVFNIKGIKEGSCLPDIQTIAQTGLNQFMLGTWTCGVFHYETEKRELKKHKNTWIDRQYGAGLNVDVKSILKENDSTFWIATSYGIIYESGRKKELIFPGTQKEDLWDPNYFYKTIKGSDGQIWAGSKRGILKIDSKTRKYQSYKLAQLAPDFLGKTSDKILDIRESPNGDIWFLRSFNGAGGHIGFTVFRKSLGKFLTYIAGHGKFKKYPYPQQTAFNFIATSDGRMMVSGERGVVIFNAINPTQFSLVTSYHGLLAEDCYNMEEDNFGNVWIQTDQGISCYTLATGKIKSYTSEDGLPVSGLSSLYKMADGHIAIGMGGSWIAILKPERLTMFNTNSPLFKFTRFDVENQTFWPEDSLELEQNVNVIKLSFSPLNFLSAIDGLFNISIERDGRASTYQTASNQITLSDLRPGWYDVKVSAPGLKSIDYHFYKKPHFWQTTWFLVVCIVVVFAIGTILLLYRQRKILAKREEERSIQFQISDMQMTALRSQIDAHFIFNALNAINNFIWQKLPEQASDYLTQFARLMRINLEHTRTDWVPLLNEIEAVTYYFNLEAVTFDLVPRLEIESPSEEEMASIKIPPMLFQPIVENVFKHAFAGITYQAILKITIRFENNMLTFIATDNGRGLDTNFKSSTHKSLASRILNERLDLLNKKLGTKASFNLERTNFAESNFTIATLIIPYKPSIQ
jgi:ligand-binding sensor domain-containing protein